MWRMLVSFVRTCAADMSVRRRKQRQHREVSLTTTSCLRTASTGKKTNTKPRLIESEAHEGPLVTTMVGKSKGLKVCRGLHQEKKN